MIYFKECKACHSCILLIGFFPGDQDDGSDDHYLHPSLAPGSSRVELVG